jgi:lipopolysaccharide transport system ATP-binding protein
MSEAIISVENLGKKYRIRHQQQRQRYSTLRDVLADKTKSVGRRIWPVLRPPSSAGADPSSVLRPPSSEDFWALKGVSFEVKQGESVGIIGRNGAGKSTLLKVLSRITEPTTGRVRICGRVASLLEVGTGFHPELTGRENIFLNGAILGMTRVEIKKKFDEIVAFAEVERFLDTPVKRYSSGMYVRLAFAVAAHLEPEILIVDEVLAVGDAEFQKKCLGKMQDVSKGGRTVLFVSHNMSAIRTLCRRAVVLDKGRVEFIGGAAEGIHHYTAETSNNSTLVWQRAESTERPVFGFEEIRVVLCGEQPQMILKCDLLLRGTEICPQAFVAIDILDYSLTPLMQAIPETKPFLNGRKGLHEIMIEIKLPPLIPGHYSADFWVGPHYTSTLDYVRQAITFEVVSSPTSDRSFPHSSNHGFLVPVSRYEYRAPTEAKALSPI